jgi:hypothetical protein
MAKIDRWQREAKKAFARKVAAAPSRVLRDRLLREYFLVDFFHDAVFRKIVFNYSARSVRFEVVSDRTIKPAYSRDWGIRLPKYGDSADYHNWHLTFSNVAHFEMRSQLTNHELMNGRVVKRDLVFRDSPDLFDYIGGRSISSKLLKRYQQDFKRNFLHLRMDCWIRTIDIIFESVQLKKLAKAPHQFRERKEFRRYIRSA